MIYSFEDFELDSIQHVLRREGIEIDVEPQVFDLLILLVSNHDRLVTKDEIVEKIWKGRAISDAAISSRISSARRVLGDNGRAQRLIKTSHNKGLRFMAVPELKKADNRAASFLAPHVTSLDTSIAGNENPSILVLPFRARPHDEMELFTADALVDEISILLSGMRGLNVIPRFVAGISLAPREDPMAIAAKIGAHYIVTGNVRRESQKLRVRAVLTNMIDGRQVWAQKFDSDMSNIFAIEDEVAHGVVGALGGKIAQIEAIRASRQKPENLRAWELSRRALTAAMDWRPETLANSIHDCTRAIELDANYAHAHAYLAFFLAWRIAQGWTSDPVTERMLSREHIETALALSDQDAEILSAVGDCYRMLKGPRAAVDFYDAMLKRDPDIFTPWPVALPIMGIAYGQAGNYERAIACVEAFELKFPSDDMGRIWSRVALGYIELCERNYARVANLHDNPPSEYNAICRVIALVQLKRIDEAQAAFQQLQSQNPALSVDHYIEHFKTYHVDLAISAELSGALLTLKNTL